MSKKQPTYSIVIWTSILCLGFLLRGIGISNPPLDAHHTRQSDTVSIAMLMVEKNFTLLWPEIGWAGPDGGVVESELPLYSCIVAIGWYYFPLMEYAWPRILSILSWISLSRNSSHPPTMELYAGLQYTPPSPISSPAAMASKTNRIYHSSIP